MKNTSVVRVCVVSALLSMASPEASASQHTYGGVAYDAVYDVIQTDDGGYIAVGNTASFDPSLTYYDVYLIKTDAAGNLQWERAIGSPYKESGYGFNRTSDGGYIIVGSKTDQTDLTTDVYVVKVDGSGNLQWERTFGGAVNEKARAVQQTLDGGFVVFGDSNSFGSIEFEWDMYVIKLDVNGAMQWETVIGGDYTEWTWDGMQTADGGYVVVGDTRSFSTPVGRADVYLVKLDANGQQVWDQTFGDVNLDTGRSVLQTADGGFMIAGESFPSGATAYRAYLIKTDPDGVEQWSQTYGAPFLNTVARCIKATPDGGFIVAGDQYVGGLDRDGYLLKVDALGGEQWEKTYGGPMIELMYSVTVTSDDGYVLAGRTLSYGAGDYDAYLIKVNGQGEHEGSWENLDHGLAGTHGDPVLTGIGTLAGGDPIGIHLTNALENAGAYLTFGLAELSAPFMGGTLVPDIFTPPGSFVSLVTNGSGEININDTWPTGVPPGLELYLQYWIDDPGGMFGFAASNAVRGTTP